MFPVPERDYVRTGRVRLAPSSYAAQCRMLAVILALQLLNLAMTLALLVR